MRFSELLLKEIRRRGVRRVFGVPGRENAAILFNEVPDVEFVTTRVEFNAGIMACFTGRVTRRPQVCFSTMGPGATNMVTAAASAILNRSPVVFISAQLETDDRFYNLTHQCVDQRRIMEPVTKWAHELERADELTEVIDRAFRVAMREPVGPVLLSIPTDLFGQDVAVTHDPDLPIDLQIECTVPAPPEASIDELHALLVSARRPLCLVGQEAIRAGAERAIRELCRSWQIPLLAAANAKGILPPDDPLNLGAASCYMEGILRYPHALREVFATVDTLFCVGYQYVDDVLPKMWAYGEKRIVSISAFDNGEIRSKFGPDLHVIGPIPETLSMLLKRPVVKKQIGPSGALRERLEKVYRGPERVPGGGLAPPAVIRCINDHLDDGVLVTDIGYYRHHAILFSKATRPGQFVTDAGLSSFGSGLPSAAAAQFLDREKRVFLLCGDGGFHSGSCDLETLVRCRLPVIIVVLDNSAFELISLYQRRGGRQPNEGVVSLGKVDFAALARANGCDGVRAESIEAMAQAIAAHTRERPLLIEIPVSYGSPEEFQISF